MSFWIIALCGVFFALPYQVAEAQTGGQSTFAPVTPPKTIDGFKVVQPAGSSFSGSITAAVKTSDDLKSTAGAISAGYAQAGAGSIWFTGNNLTVNVPEKSGYHINNYCSLAAGAAACSYPINPYIHGIKQSTTGTFNDSTGCAVGSITGSECFSSVTGSDTKATMSFSFYDTTAQAGVNQNYYFYIEVLPNGSNQRALMPISNVVQYQPTRTDSATLIQLVRDHKYDTDSTGANFPKNATANDLGLKVQLSGQMLSDPQVYGYCTFSISFQGKESFDIMQPVAESQDKSYVPSIPYCSGQLDTGKIKSGAIPATWPDDAGHAAPALVSGTNTFVVTMKITDQSGGLIHTGGSHGAPPITQTSTLSFTYNPATGVLSEPKPGSAPSATTSPNGDQDGSDDIDNQCMKTFDKSYTVVHVIEYNTIGRPLCSLIEIIVSLSTDLATYAINYFLKPALGLS